MPERTSHSQSIGLGPDYTHLSGPGLVDQLANDGRLDVLEAFWLFGDPVIASKVVDALARSDQPRMSSHLAQEVTAPSLADPLPVALIDAIDEHWPPLASEDVDALAERLQDDAPLANPTYEQNRPALERWVIGQENPRAGELALAAIRHETKSSETPALREAAFERCVRDHALLNAAAATLVETTESSPTAGTWADVALFVQTACRKESTVPVPVRRLVVWLVGSMVDLCSSDALPEALRGPVWNAGARGLEEVIQGDSLPDVAGSRAAIRLIETSPTARERARLTGLVAAHQPNLFSFLLAESAGWKDAEWRRRLAAMRKHSDLVDGVVSSVIAAAPETVMHECVEVILTPASDGRESHIQLVAGRLRDVLTGLAVDDADPAFEARIRAVRWPKRTDNEHARERLADLLAAAWPPDIGTELVLAAWRAERISPDVAAALIPAGEVEAALILLAGDPIRRELLARAAIESHPDTVEAVARLQQDAFGLDLARALAASHPPAAFAGTAAGWDRLSEREKDALVSLLDEHGTLAQQDVFAAVMADSRSQNAKRRARVIRIVADRTPVGEPLPDFVVAQLEAGALEPRRAAVDAVGRVAPRDLPTVQRVAGIASREGPLKQTAIAVLDTLASEYVSDLAEAPTDAVGAAIDLLGEASRPLALDPLLEYVGPDAKFDVADLRQRAAKAISAVCGVSGSHTTSAQQARLVALLEGETAEVDATAFEHLSRALASVQLGESDSLTVLYEEVAIPLKPGIDPPHAFGGQLELLVRHLGILARERRRGDVARATVVQNLDVVAEQLARRTYLLIGDSEAMKREIAAGSEEPRYGNLLGALKNTKASKAVPHLEVVHDLRSTKSHAHASKDEITDSEMTQAWECFRKGAKILVGTIETETRPR